MRPGEQAEVELKLLAPQRTLEKLREMSIILQHARNRGSFRRLETVYYDTPERLQCQRGTLLRCEMSGRRRTSPSALETLIGRTDRNLGDSGNHAGHSDH